MSASVPVRSSEMSPMRHKSDHTKQTTEGNFMLSKVRTLKGYSLDALDELDGKIGKVKE